MHKKSAPHPKNNLIIYLLVHPVPPVLIQNTSHRRAILFIHIKLQGISL
ncbi:hypothetical protein ECH7EC4486_6155 [Escherichia coli O157:H7 str. EC4486]|nr:hypothetical protein ECH7EC4486_6155 [Escherichia coli O157:H7 str. EC4486]